MTPDTLAIREQTASPVIEPPSIQAHGLTLQLDDNTLLDQLDFQLPRQGITTLIGPSGAGKSSLLRCLNGLQQGWHGELLLEGRPLNDWPGGWDALRRHIGLIAQKPCVFPCSIQQNVAFGIQGWRKRRNARATVERALHQAALWDEVKDRLAAPAEKLSLGQQQRLCIARALAIQPKLLLLDEPTASLDPKSKQLIEQSMSQLARQIPLLYVSHDLEQAQRLDGQVIFMCEGRIIEQGTTVDFFNKPQRIESREFLRWSVCD